MTYWVAATSGVNTIVSLFCKRALWRDNILQKRPIIESILPTVATPYLYVCRIAFIILCNYCATAVQQWEYWVGTKNASINQHRVCATYLIHEPKCPVLFEVMVCMKQKLDTGSKPRLQEASEAATSRLCDIFHSYPWQMDYSCVQLLHNCVQLLHNCCATMGVPSRNEERIHQSTSNLCDISHSLIQMPRFGRDNGMHETKVRHGVETPPPRSFWSGNIEIVRHISFISMAGGVFMWATTTQLLCNSGSTE